MPREPRSPIPSNAADSRPAAQRIVVKVGSGVIAGGGRLKPKVVADLAYDVTVLRHRGHEIILVVSGAVASGFRALGFERPPREVLQRQAAAAIGQHRLMATLDKLFSRHRTLVAQLLMSADDIENRRRFLSARHTLGELLERGVVPVINENDALGNHEAVIGDNDHLAALVTNVASADLLVLLSRVPGILAADAPGGVLPRVEAGTDIEHYLRSDRSDTGVGGMQAKVSAARLASRSGVSTVIANGLEKGILQRIVAGEPVGTRFVPSQARLSQRKRWIAVRARSLGTIVVDDGARRALLERGASLLSGGVIDVRGQFRMGARVEIVDRAGQPIAVGLVSYDADEIRRVMGRRPGELRTLLGYDYVRAIVHRDDLVLT